MSKRQIKLSEWGRKQLILQRDGHLPSECCAILLGRFKNNVAIIENICPIENISKMSGGLFMMDPQQQGNIVTSVKDGGGNKFVHIVAHYHSHPIGSKGIPSHIDFEMAKRGWAIGLHIIHGEDGINAWYWDGEKFSEAEVINA